MFGSKTALDEELKELQKNEKITKAKLELKNEDGLNLETERTTESVIYTLRGGGDITARAPPRRYYNSSKKGKRIWSPGYEEWPERRFLAAIGSVRRPLGRYCFCPSRKSSCLISERRSTRTGCTTSLSVLPKTVFRLSQPKYFHKGREGVNLISGIFSNSESSAIYANLEKPVKF
jgi:hypothetical protein